MRIKIKRIIKKLLLLRLVLDNSISFGYWWNYDVSPKTITLMRENVKNNMQVLKFGRDLKLKGEDEYIVKNTDDRAVNKIIKNPIIGGVYIYDDNKDKFLKLF